MNLNEIAREIHENAVAHGWWETERPARREGESPTKLEDGASHRKAVACHHQDGDRPTSETIALIHSEWSEALKEYRAGRPMVWKSCDIYGGMCEGACRTEGDYCSHRDPKPEGVAVGLVDGCIRILDFSAHVWPEPWKDLTMQSLAEDADRLAPEEELPALVAMLHYVTAIAYYQLVKKENDDARSTLYGCMVRVYAFLRDNGCDMEAILREKHAYNQTCPYRHGGKRC